MSRDIGKQTIDPKAAARVGGNGKGKRAVPAPDSNGGVYAVERALAIVTALEQRAGPMTLADVAQATGLYKSTVLRVLVSLDRFGLVVRRADQRYVLGEFAFRLGRAYEATHHLKEYVYPELEWLVANGAESASFHIVHDAQRRLCMFRIDSKHGTLDSIRAGDLLPMDRGAAGKVLKAECLMDAKPASLIQTSYGERDPACAAVAAPVFGPDENVIGAISLSGPAERFTAAAVKSMSRMILAAAERATVALNGRWPSAARHR